MNYKIIRLAYKDAKENLNRELLVRDDLSLIELGCVLGSSLYSTLEHDFMFKTSSNSFVLENYGNATGQTLYMSDYLLADLGDHFEYIYDFGDEWRFDCEVIGSQKKRGKQFAYALKGTGVGLFEDGRCFFDASLVGDYDFNIYGENDPDDYIPYNIPFSLLEDITYFDVEEMNNEFKHTLPFDIYDFIKETHDLGFEKNVENINLEDYVSDEEIEDFFDERIDNEDIDILQLMLADAVQNHINKLDYVKETYDRLLDKYNDPTIASAMIMEVLFNEIKDVLLGDAKSLDGEYKKKIKRLK